MLVNATSVLFPHAASGHSIKPPRATPAYSELKPRAIGKVMSSLLSGWPVLLCLQASFQKGAHQTALQKRIKNLTDKPDDPANEWIQVAAFSRHNHLLLGNERLSRGFHHVHGDFSDEDLHTSITPQKKKKHYLCLTENNKASAIISTHCDCRIMVLIGEYPNISAPCVNMWHSTAVDLKSCTGWKKGTWNFTLYFKEEKQPLLCAFMPKGMGQREKAKQVENSPVGSAGQFGLMHFLLLRAED